MAVCGHEKPYQGKTNVWITPRELTKALGKFDLDPCCNEIMPWHHAKHNFSTDGLNKKWFGRVWCNPPYGPYAEHWLRKLGDHGNGIALIFARTETRSFFDNCWDSASAIFFFKSRIKFYDENGNLGKSNAGAPSCLVAYGEQNIQAITRSGLTGSLVTSWQVTH